MREANRIGVGPQRFIVTVLAALVLASGVADAARAAPDRARTLETLEAIAASGSAFDFRAWINDGRGAALEVGDTVQYHFESGRTAYLTLVHVDTHGVVTVVFPNAAGFDPQLVGGQARAFPSEAEGFVLRAEPPVGVDYVLALATDRPLTIEELGLDTKGLPLAILEAEAGPAFAARLADRFAMRPSARRAAARIEQEIVGRSGGTQYESTDIVAFFNTRTRSIARPRLDLHVHFASGEATLDETARHNLDVVAEALSDATLRQARFAVNGHTDDVGEEDYNARLAQRRAAAVVDYLASQGEIDPTRLEVRSFGETQPLVADESEHARQLNRRVEFELLR